MYDEEFNACCEMEGYNNGFLRVYAQTMRNNTYYASLTYIDNDDHEVIFGKVSVKSKSFMIERIQEFVRNVERKIER